LSHAHTHTHIHTHTHRYTSIIFKGQHEENLILMNIFYCYPILSLLLFMLSSATEQRGEKDNYYIMFCVVRVLCYYMLQIIIRCVRINQCIWLDVITNYTTCSLKPCHCGVNNLHPISLS